MHSDDSIVKSTDRMKLPGAFYQQTDVVHIAVQLLGKVLYTHIDGQTCSGLITETEAYNGIVDKASHAYGGRRTARTEIMYATGGTAYVYLCYGIHSLFNVVTNVEGVPHAILIRGIAPLSGIETMEQRRKKKATTRGFASGPGTVSQALGIHYKHSGLSLLEDQLWLEDAGIVLQQEDILVSARIGVDYAAEDALLPYRFNIRDEVVRGVVKVLTALR